jgi:phenylacetate-CoA ligase
MKNIPYPIFQIFAYLTSLIPLTIRMGQSYRSSTRLIKAARLWTPKYLRTWQLNQLQKIIRHATESVPWYRETYRALGISWQDIRHIEDIRHLPIIDKNTIHEAPGMFVSERASKKKMHETVTSGSTGIPLRFYLPHDYAAYEKAFLAPLLARYGCSNNDRHVILRTQKVSRNPHTPLWTKNPHRNQLVISSYLMSESTIVSIASAIKQFKPRYILAIPSIASIFSKFLIDVKASIGIPPNVIILGSENSYHAQREHISRAFKCATIMHYGQTEGIATAVECEPYGPYHVNPLYSYTEVVSENGKVATRCGERGEIVGTSFYNYSMPLIRYRSADIVTIGKGTSDWGLEGDVWDRIDGRSIEMVKTHDGRWIMAAALMFGTHDHTLANVVQVQIEQKSVGCLILRIVRSQQYAEKDEQAISQMISNFTNNGFKLIFKYVDSIPKTKSGKHPLLIQHLELPEHISSTL